MAKSQQNLSPAARAAFRRVQKGVDALGTSIATIETNLRETERKIEAEARERIRRLRSDVRKQRAVIEDRRRQAERTLKRLSVAAGGSWRDVRKVADKTLGDARRVTKAVVRRFRKALRPSAS